MSDSRLSSMQWAGSVKNIYILLVALVTIKNYREIKERINLHLYMTPFLLVASICLAFSPDIITAVQKTLSYFLLLFLVPNFFSYLYSEYKETFLKNIVWMVFMIILLGLLFKFLNPPIVVLAERFRGMLGNPNGLGIYCFLFIVFFTIVIEFFPNLFTRNEKILIYSAAGISLIYSGARSSLIAIILFFAFRYFHKLSPILGFILLIVAIGSYELVTSNIETIVYALGIEEYFRVDTLKDGSGRLIAWNFAWLQIEKSYFFGRGFSFNEYIFRENYVYLLNLGHQGSSAHNAYLTFWLDTGLVGLVAFLGGFISFIFSISKLSISVFPLLYAVLFSNQFESWLTASLNPFTILLLMSLSLIYVAGKDKLQMEAEEDSEEINDKTIALT